MFGRLIARGEGGCHSCHNVTVSQGVGVELIGVTGCDKEIKEIKEIKEVKDGPP